LENYGSHFSNGWNPLRNAAHRDGSPYPFAEISVHLRLNFSAPARVHPAEAETPNVYLDFLQVEEVLEQFFAVLGEDRFGVELNAVHRMFGVLNAHNFAFGSFRRNLQAGWQAFARSIERARQPFEDALSFMEHRRGFAVHQALRADDLAAVDFADRLMAEADAEQRNTRAKFANDIAGNSSLARRAGAGADQYLFGVERNRLLDGDLIVAENFHLRTELAKVLHEVVGERIVVIDDQNHCILSQRRKDAKFQRPFTTRVISN